MLDNFTHSDPLMFFQSPVAASAQSGIPAPSSRDPIRMPRLASSSM